MEYNYAILNDIIIDEYNIQIENHDISLLGKKWNGAEFVETIKTV